MPNIDELSENHFHCGETPLWFPPDFNLNQLANCTSCTLRITASLAGPGLIQPSADGYTIDENPTVSLTYNGLQHTLLETRLVLPAAHRLPGSDEPSVGEVQLYFRADYNIKVFYCVCVPLKEGTGVGNSYFQTLGKQGQHKTSVASLLTKGSSLYSYLGADMRGRTKAVSRPVKLCEPILQKVTYMVCMEPAYIRSVDLRRLIKFLKKSVYKAPPVPSAAATATRIRSFVTILPKLLVDGPVSKQGRKQATYKQNEAIPTKALQCRRIDPSKDVEGDKIYVDGVRPTDSTLESELQNAADSAKEWEDKSEPTVQPRDVERTFGVVIGTLLGIVLLATVAYYTMKFIYGNYRFTLDTLYDKTFNPVKSMSIKVPGIPGMSSLTKKLCST